MSLLNAAPFVAGPGLSFTWRMNLPVPSNKRDGSGSATPRKNPTLPRFIDAPHGVMLRRVAESAFAVQIETKRICRFMRFSSIIYGRQKAQRWDTTDARICLSAAVARRRSDRGWYEPRSRTSMQIALFLRRQHFGFCQKEKNSNLYLGSQGWSNSSG